MIQSLLIHTAKILRRTPLVEKGRHTDDTVITFNIKCLVQPKKELATRSESGEETFSDSILYCNYDIDIIVNDTVEFEDRAYQVLGVLDEAGQSDHLKVLLKGPDYGKGIKQSS